MNGFIKVHRQLQQWEWYTDSESVHFFIHCILMANWKPKKWQGKEIKRGQFITSLQNLSMQTGMSVKQVRKRIKRLEDTGEITSKGTNKYTIITVCKYDTYQTIENEEGNQKTNKGQSKGNQRATTEEGKEVKKVKEVYPFQDFWDDYSKKKGRSKCENKWGGVSKSDKLKIKEFIPIYKEYEPDEQYRKDPYTFLNSEIWNDDWDYYKKEESKQGMGQFLI